MSPTPLPRGDDPTPLFDPPQRLPNPRMHNLIEDPRERTSVASMNTWVWHPTFKIADDFAASLKKEPPIPPGTPDPYVPASRP